MSSDDQEQSSDKNEEGNSESVSGSKSKTKDTESKAEGKNPLDNPEVLTKRKVIINTSTSKQMYSFPTTIRFKTEGKDSSSFFYNFPSTLNKRGASIGYGEKAKIYTEKVLNDKIYDIYRGFDAKKSGPPKYSFGYGRDVCKINKSKNESQLPGPFSYSPYKSFGQNALKFTMSSRYNNKNTMLNVPGPGSYDFHYERQYGNSELINSVKSKFPNEARFKRDEDKTANVLITPGPGAYRSEGIDGKGIIHNSRYSTNLGRSMGGRLAAIGEKLITPGPGAYDFFSDFEGFGRYRFKKPKKNESKTKDEQSKEGTQDDE